MLVKKLFKINRFCIVDDYAQVLEAGQGVLLGVQHLLGRLLHVPVRLLGEHPAATGPLSAGSPQQKVNGVGGEETSPSDSFTPQPRGPQQSRPHPPRAAAPRPLRLGLQYGGSRLRALNGARETRAGCPPPPPPPPASSGRRSAPQAGPGIQSHGGGALGGGCTTRLSLRPP